MAIRGPEVVMGGLEVAMGASRGEGGQGGHGCGGFKVVMGVLRWMWGV